MNSAAGLIFDDSRHYIDHLAPFCALMGWPLIVCEGSVAELACRYYPDLEIIEKNRWDLLLPKTIVSCDPRGLIESSISLDSSAQLFWLPHGNSDKGWKGPFFEPLKGETALVYGQRMIDFMSQKKIAPQTIRIGNFRLAYWMKHRSFYEGIVKKEILLRKASRTYLYAPTWDDREGNGSFWKMFPLLADRLPANCNLIVKIHPNTEIQFAPELERMIGRFSKKTQIVFLTDFPPVYALLNICDVYIGDMSSIGYDYLYWNRPMYFLKTENRPHFLYQCGTEITAESIGSIFSEPHPDQRDAQRHIYAYTFDPYQKLNLLST